MFTVVVGCHHRYGLQLALAMSPTVAKLARIPEGHQAYAATMLGYPQYNYVAIPPRKAIEVSWV